VSLQSKRSKGFHSNKKFKKHCLMYDVFRCSGKKYHIRLVDSFCLVCFMMSTLDSRLCERLVCYLYGAMGGPKISQ